MSRLLAWIAKLLPKQKNSGEGAVQVGKAGGNVTVVHLTQHNTNHWGLSGNGSPSEAPVAPARKQHRIYAQPNKAAQHALLKRLDEVTNRDAVLAFMRREFNTGLVIDLDGQQLFRLQRYIETVLHSELAQRWS